MKRIALLGHGFVTWEGGVAFLRFILDALNTCLPLAENKFYLFLPLSDKRLRSASDGSISSLWKAFTEKKVAEPEFPHNPISLDSIADSLGEFWRHIHPISVGSDPKEIVASYRALKLDGMLPAMTPVSTDPDIVWVGYIYDFQHKYFPNLFAEADCRHRDRLFAQTLATARSVIVASQNVASDIQRFFGRVPAQVVSLPVCPHPRPPGAHLPTFAELKSRYSLNAPFFVISNQFWMHKDHATAFRALAHISPKYPSIELVCTGPTDDYRNPQHFPRLMTLAQDLGVAKNIRVLGQIPKDDQMGIVQASAALIQPTLFEGGPGGGAFGDALSLGVPSLVSDIPVNLEISEPNVTFFQAGNSQTLAELMRKILEQPPPRPSAQQLYDAAIQRRFLLARALLQSLYAAGMK